MYKTAFPEERPLGVQTTPEPAELAESREAEGMFVPVVLSVVLAFSFAVQQLGPQGASSPPLESFGTCAENESGSSSAPVESTEIFAEFGCCGPTECEPKAVVPVKAAGILEEFECCGSSDCEPKAFVPAKSFETCATIECCEPCE